MLDLLGIYHEFERGQQSVRENRLADIDAAMRQQSFDMQRQQFGDAQKKQFATDFAREAYDAKDPAQYQALIQRWEAQGHKFDDWERDPANRDAMISRVVDVGDRMGLDLRRQEAQRSQSNADRTYALQVRNQEGDERYRADQLEIEREKLEKAGDSRVPMGYRQLPNGDYEAIHGGPADPRVKASQGAGGVTTKMHNDAVAVDQAYRNLDTALTDYQGLIKKTGVSMLPGQENDAVQQARTNLQLQLKELYNLGVLNGPDLGLMQNMIFDPQTSWLDPIGNAAKVYGATGLLGSTSVADRADASIGQLRSMLKTIRDNKTKGILDESGVFKGGAAPDEETDQGASAQPGNADVLIEQANEAIRRGADPAKVRQRLREQGIDADFGE